MLRVPESVGFARRRQRRRRGLLADAAAHTQRVRVLVHQRLVAAAHEARVELFVAATAAIAVVVRIGGEHAAARRRVIEVRALGARLVLSVVQSASAHAHHVLFALVSLVLVVPVVVVVVVVIYKCIVVVVVVVVVVVTVAVTVTCVGVARCGVGW